MLAVESQGPLAMAEPARGTGTSIAHMGTPIAEPDVLLRMQGLS